MKGTRPPRHTWTQTTIAVSCAACGQRWRAPFRLPLPIDRALAVMRGIVALGCPRCSAGGNHVMTGTGPRVLGLPRRGARK